MRCRWAIRGAITTLALVVAIGATDDRSSSAAGGRCHRALPEAQLTLPAPLIVTTSCGRFRVGQNGGLTYLGPRTLPVPLGTCYWADLTWYRFSRGHLLVGRGYRRLWRSRGTYASTYPANIGAVVLGARGLAFSYFRSLGEPSRLYLARYGSSERPLGRGETPLEFLRSGELVTQRERGGAIVLRTPGGRLDGVIVPHASDPQVDRQSGTLVFRVGLRLGVFDRGRVRELADLRMLGIKGWPVVEPLGRLVAVRDRRRLVVLDYEGRLIAATALPARQQPADTVSSSVVANENGTAVAFSATLGNTAYRSRGIETVYLLGAGEQQARPLFGEQLDFQICERGADLAWHGRWLLYSDSERRAAVIDSSQGADPIELSGLIARLPGSGGDGFFDISWSARR